MNIIYNLHFFNLACLSHHDKSLIMCNIDCTIVHVPNIKYSVDIAMLSKVWVATNTGVPVFGVYNNWLVYQLSIFKGRLNATVNILEVMFAMAV